MKTEHYVLGPGSEGIEKRIYQLLCKVDSVKACYQDTWCSLLKTKGFLKSQYVYKHGCERVGALVKKQYGKDVERWHVELIGSTSKLDVIACRKQRFLLEVKYK
ncbi:hypothetical protein Hena1_00120 [Erwinia phage Hena1]|uniref:Uncharacterized protein n=1 Tax=Erwinia phage Hena1 TaxID=2678601 RepID=A0A6B9J5X2_9CAUD|nr:hypothetical protein HWC84_gp011 [Erwinia phage Hena1]QGZ16188.1 hypothetical protein Hena1_00120 [Erwinia phage Hena1]